MVVRWGWIGRTLRKKVRGSYGMVRTLCRCQDDEKGVWRGATAGEWTLDDTFHAETNSSMPNKALNL